jgi:hypothetical protein
MNCSSSAVLRVLPELGFWLSFRDASVRTIRSPTSKCWLIQAGVNGRTAATSSWLVTVPPHHPERALLHMAEPQPKPIGEQLRRTAGREQAPLER